ncbi:16.0 kDa heat shock protein, peroxisomal-like [Phragmites australis]|uniref:16.0 kDa heat shock protein, peroxisomal-like n=1 Tax=Phragmites australis TaxID=29695 RepID=UPI002D7A2143|nr:16.0 kDa heat shock protein, peroxisomal-like [Phragmites australis]
MADFFFGSPFRRLLHARPLTAEWPSSAAAAMDWVETPTSHVLRINAPGLGKDDVKVQVEEGNVLTIRGAKEKEKEKKEDDEKEGVVWHVAERGKPEFARAVALPENVRVEGIRAGMENGVLTVVVPKEPAPARSRPRPIAVSSKL